jgi:hypothetical protein
LKADIETSSSSWHMVTKASSSSGIDWTTMIGFVVSFHQARTTARTPAFKFQWFYLVVQRNQLLIRFWEASWLTLTLFNNPPTYERWSVSYRTSLELRPPGAAIMDNVRASHILKGKVLSHRGIGGRCLATQQRLREPTAARGAQARQRRNEPTNISRTTKDEKLPVRWPSGTVLRY